MTEETRNRNEHKTEMKLEQTV